MNTIEEINQFVNNLYLLTLDNNANKLRELLLDKLEEILNYYTKQPSEDNKEYILFEFLFFRFNELFEKSETEIEKDFPKNSRLLKFFEFPDDVNALLFHVFNYLTPNGYIGYNREFLLDCIGQIRLNRRSQMPIHNFEYLKHTLNIKENENLHVMSI
jgi:hypothetical protein